MIQGLKQPEQRKKTLIIAEIGTAHGGSFEKAKQLTDAAVLAGADCIKFQWVYADEILHPASGLVKLPSGDILLYERFKALETKPNFFAHIQDYVHSQGKAFMCSPFGSRSLQELFAIKPDYIKIASPELNHIPLLRELVELEKYLPLEQRIPIVLSSGVSTMGDIQKALSILKPLRQKNTNALSLLHCITSYPAPPEEYNLALISRYIDELNIPVGLSDHSLDPCLVPLIALGCGASLIEKHITLSRQNTGLDDPVALPPDQFAQMVEAVRRAENIDFEDFLSELYNEYGEELVEQVIGTGKKELAPSEAGNYGKTNRSIHFMRNMKQGEIIGIDDIAVLRTEKLLRPGIHPKYYEKVLGKKLCADAENGDGLQWFHIDRK